MTDLVAYLGLFASAFAAATILPAQSEALLVGLVLSEAQPVWALVAVASVGNVLGSVVNWILGTQVERFRGRRWFPVSDATLERAKGLVRPMGPLVSAAELGADRRRPADAGGGRAQRAVLVVLRPRHHRQGRPLRRARGDYYGCRITA